MNLAKFRIYSIAALSLTLVACQTNANLAPVVSRSTHLGPRPAYYTVHRGDTLYSIAFSFGIDFRDLAAYNDIQSPYAIHPGQKLVLKGRKKIAKAKPVIKPVRRVATKPVKAVAPEPQFTKNIRWQWPVKGRIIKKYSRANKGIDIGGQYGQPIYAAASGQVVYAGHGIRGYGNLLIIKHNDNYLAAYAYNSKLLVRQGHWVKKGQKIALMGRNNHRQAGLHFEIRRNGRAANPLKYLRA